MNHEVLFTPFVTVEVTEGGEVEAVKVDWSDTLKNDYQDGVEIWVEHQGEEPPTAKAACEYLDDTAVRERVLAALQPSSATRFTPAEVELLREALDSYEYWEHRDTLPHDSGHITIMDDQDYEAQITLGGELDEDEMETADEAWAAVKAARELDAKLGALVREEAS